MRHSPALKAAAVLLALLFALPANAQSESVDPTTEQARTHYEAGTTHYNLGRFEEAIAEYRKAYELKADPVFLFNIAQSYRQLGHDERALFFYRRFLSTAPDTPYRDEVQGRIDELEKRVESQNTEQTPAVPDPASLPPPTAPEDRPMEASLLDTPAEPEQQDSFWQKWWFWAAAGAVVLVGGTAIALTVSSGGDEVPSTALGHQEFFQ